MSAMKRLNAIAILALAGASPVFAAPPAGVGAHVGYVANDAGTGSDFDNSAVIDVFGQLRFNPHVALEFGYVYSATTTDEGSDNQGTYKIELASNDLYGGMRVQTQDWRGWSAYGRIGLLYYRSEIDFSETFYGLKPAGEIEEVEEGIGYYFGGGVSYAITPSLLLDAGITYRVRQEYLEDSIRPFDVDQLGMVGGLVWLLP